MRKTFIILILVKSAVEDALDVVTTGGTVRGMHNSCGTNCHYIAFKGIPYAQPPIDDLRFRAPLPHPGWQGILKAFDHGPSCPSDSSLGGLEHSENCLFVNVYSQNLTSSMAVMVFIHGGSFTGQSGNSFIYGPDFLVTEEIVVVSLNYRLGSLGFLSTGDNNAPGNYGLKDGVLALKWVRDNIKAFGGDPNRVTIFGESAGGVFVHYLVLSPAAKGLFHRAISQSGSALNPWAYQTDPAEQARRYAKRLNISYTSNINLISQLRKVDYNVLIKAIPEFIELPIPRGHQPFPFVPCKDPKDVSYNEIFLPDDPLQLILSGSFNHVPYIIGFNDAESLFSISELRNDPHVFDVLNNDPYLFVPPRWNVSRNSPEAMNIIREIRHFYFKNSTLNFHFRYNYTQYNTDVLFVRGIDKAARLHADVQKSKNPVYYYRFSFVGRLNIVKTILLVREYPGAVHGDDLFYLFKITPIPLPLLPALPSNPALVTRLRMIRMWTNFAKFGNPTPLKDSIVNTQWNRISYGKQQFLSINHEVEMDEHPFDKRVNFWNQLEAKYNLAKS